MTTMTLDELIERLTEIREEVADTLSDTAASDAAVRGLERQLTWRVDDESGDVAVYLTDAGQTHGDPYLPGEISEQLGWA